jgi:hypothetical protein
VTPDDLDAVSVTWRRLRPNQDQLRRRLADTIAQRSDHPSPGAVAHWLVDAVDQLVPTLGRPAELATRAATVVSPWPATRPPPSYAVEGTAFIDALNALRPLDAESAQAWRRAWHLLAEVLAERRRAPRRMVTASTHG